MQLLLCSVVGYFFGGISPSYLLAKRKGFDIRESGTGNAGATNAMFALGFRSGLLVMVLDILKAVLSVLVAKLVFAETALAGIVSGISCTVGHIFSPYLHFRGGKGTACFCGVVISLTPQLILPMFLLAFLLGMIFNRASILPLILTAVYPGLYYLCSDYFAGTMALFLLFPLLLWSHRGNFTKYRNGEETPFRTMLFKHDLDNCVERKSHDN